MKKLIEKLRKAVAAGGATAFVFGLSSFATAGELPEWVQTPQEAAKHMTGADVWILGEVHDNGQHHRNQATLLDLLQPKAVVWEMLTAEQADAAPTDLFQDSDATRAALDWDNSGWPDFELYAPVFAAAADARQYGALMSRESVGEVLAQGIVPVFGEQDAARFGLDLPLADWEQSEREADQMAAHCDAMPASQMPMMVDFQRLRDASLARAVDQALTDTGGPVAVITGNGHARTDRGLVVYLARARPAAQILSLGQAEDGSVGDNFDLVIDSPAVDRPDPCAAFRAAD